MAISSALQDDLIDLAGAISNIDHSLGTAQNGAKQSGASGSEMGACPDGIHTGRVHTYATMRDFLAAMDRNDPIRASTNRFDFDVHVGVYDDTTLVIHARVKRLTA